MEEKQWSKASVDLRLGFSFTALRGLHGVTVSVADGLKTLDSADFWRTRELKNVARAIMQGPAKKDRDYLKKDRPTQPPGSRD